MVRLKRTLGNETIELDDGTHAKSFRGWAVVNNQDQVITIVPSVVYHLYNHQWEAQEVVDRLNGKVMPEIKSIRGKDLLKVRVGQMVVSCTGPSSSPMPGLASKVGVVVGHEKNKWGISLEVEWDGDRQHIDSISLLHDPKSKCGTGVYAYPSLRLAISE